MSVTITEKMIVNVRKDFWRHIACGTAKADTACDVNDLFYYDGYCWFEERIDNQTHMEQAGVEQCHYFQYCMKGIYSRDCY